MDFAMVEAFVAVVESGGFTRAASLLHLSQPALSRRIALLEHELGQAVFERGRAGARLTDAGEAFLPHAQAALACVRDGIAAVRALAKGDVGRVTLAIVGTLASSALTARLARFRAAHPALRLLLRTGSSVEVSALVRRGEATLGLRYSADPAPDLVSREIDHEPLLVVAAPSHRLASARRIAPRRLAGETWVGFPARRGSVLDPFGHVLARRLAATGLDESDLVVIDSLTAQKRLVEGGFGLALVPVTSVHEELARGTLCVLDVPELQAQVDVALVQRRGAFLSPAAQRLIDELVRTEPEPVRTPRRTMVSRRRVR
jgi:DNA-binding transcriptional LysR family regulator